MCGAIGPASQGQSVALSADGNTALVGGFEDNNTTGAAWVFTRDRNGNWTQQGSKLVGTGGVGFMAQGNSVALSADGNTALVGGPDDNNSTGALWIFTRDSNGNWSQLGSKLVGRGAVGPAGQGGPVALSADGNTAVEGAWADNNNLGAVWVFTRDSNGNWSQLGSKLVGSGAINSNSYYGVQQGWSVALSGDGKTALEGGWGDNNRTGAVWPFVRTRIEIFWQNSSAGQVGVWYMGGADGSAFESAGYLSGPVAGWKVVAVADMNGDGVPDLIWQEDGTNMPGVWYMGGSGGSTLLSWKYLAGSEPGWRIVGAEDLDRNGHPDLIWQQRYRDLRQCPQHPPKLPRLSR